MLIVDDEKAIIEHANLYLVKGGYKTCSARNGTQALEQVHKYQQVLMIQDVDGFKVCRNTNKDTGYQILENWQER